MVKISSKIRKFYPDDNKENEREIVVTQIEAEPELGEKVEMATIDGDKLINGKWYMTGNSTKEGEFDYLIYICEYCSKQFKLIEPLWNRSECICQFEEYIEQRTEKPHTNNLCTCGATKLLPGGRIIKEFKSGGIRTFPICLKCVKLAEIQERKQD